MIILGKIFWDSQDCTENPCLEKKNTIEKFKDSIFVIIKISQIYETNKNHVRHFIFYYL